MILDLSLQIANATTIEDVKKLRNRINYYIEKIKKELKKRNISLFDMISIKDNTKSIQEDIITYIDCMKREKIISEIIRLNDNFDNLNNYELKYLHELLHNELSYIRKNINKITDSSSNNELSYKDQSKKNKGRLKTAIMVLMLAGTVSIASFVGFLAKNIFSDYESKEYNEEQIIAYKNEENNEEEITDEEKRTFLANYCNTKSLSELNNFIFAFINNMSKYGKSYTQSEMLNILYEIANLPLIDKISYVKSVYNITDTELDEIAATYGAEGFGGGLRYQDVFAAATTGVNRTQFENWIYSTEMDAGIGTGENLYYVTANKCQFAAYGCDYYYSFLGDHNLVSYYATIDAIYLNHIYGIYLHDFTEFRSPETISTGMQYIFGGNRYIHEYDYSDRIIYTNDEQLVLKFD
jgi:hypothetical protein